MGCWTQRNVLVFFPKVAWCAAVILVTSWPEGIRLLCMCVPLSKQQCWPGLSIIERGGRAADDHGGPTVASQGVLKDPGHLTVSVRHVALTQEGPHIRPHRTHSRFYRIHNYHSLHAHCFKYKSTSVDHIDLFHCTEEGLWLSHRALCQSWNHISQGRQGLVDHLGFIQHCALGSSFTHLWNTKAREFT